MFSSKSLTTRQVSPSSDARLTERPPGSLLCGPKKRKDLSVRGMSVSAETALPPDRRNSEPSNGDRVISGHSASDTSPPLPSAISYSLLSLSITTIPSLKRAACITGRSVIITSPRRPFSASTLTMPKSAAIQASPSAVKVMELTFLGLRVCKWARSVIVLVSPSSGYISITPSVETAIRYFFCWLYRAVLTLRIVEPGIPAMSVIPAPGSSLSRRKSAARASARSPSEFTWFCCRRRK